MQPLWYNLVDKINEQEAEEAKAAAEKAALSGNGPTAGPASLEDLIAQSKGCWSAVDCASSDGKQPLSRCAGAAAAASFVVQRCSGESLYC